MNARDFRTRRALLRVTQEELARIFDVDKRSIKRYEQSGCTGPPAVLMRILTEGRTPYLVGPRLGRFPADFSQRNSTDRGTGASPES